jgi:restriction system protein
MDSSPIYQVLFSLWYLIPLFIFATVVQSAFFKGLMGEFIINVFAQWQLDKEQYHLIKNITLATDDGTTEIDHIIVSIYGVFVVETKNMKGWIFGSPHQKMWTQKIYKHKNKFQNPLHQNYKHTKTLETLLELEESQVHSVIVFIGDSKFKTPPPNNVTYGMGYIRYIKSKTDAVLSELKKNDIIETIRQGRLKASFKTNRKHVSHVKEIIAEKENKQNCPKCGNEMVIRETKKGKNKGKQFWGCTTFPKCRTIKASD